MRKHVKNIIKVVLTLSATAAFSQNRDKDTINTGVIDVVKPYTPSVSDAFKVKETPTIDDETTQTKKTIKYNIFSFPVASIFTPAKGKAAAIEKKKPKKLFDNYASVGVGTYTSFLGEVYLNHAISRTESVGGYVSHHSSQGGIEDVVFDDNFYNSKINVNYATKLRYLAWNVDAGFQHQHYNWYGVPESQINIASVSGMDGGHSFFNTHLGGDVTFEDTYINSGSFIFRHFSDNMGSAENRFKAHVKLDLPIRREEIATDVTIDFLSGGFDINYTNTGELNYGNFIFGTKFLYQLQQDDLTVNLGVAMSFLMDSENKENTFYLYPNITAAYKLVNNILIAYGGIEGGLVQNSYYDLASKNPYVSPTLLIMPTDQQYNAYVGLKGKISSAMSYDISGRYMADRNKALFRNNEITLTTQDFSFGNSFGVVYDDVETFSLSGEISADINRNFKLALKMEYFTYTSDVEPEAWNLPETKGNLFLDYQINENWYTGANVFYIGMRKDQFYLNDGVSVETPITVDLDSYVDANAHLGYHVNEQLSVFAKANNILNDNYQQWQNFPVQGIQFLAGATYKFDF